MSFTNPPAKGTIGYRAFVWRKSRTANNFESGYKPTAAEAIAECLANIDRNRGRVKPTDIISCTQWTATGDGCWQTELLGMLGSSQRVTVGDARIEHRLMGSMAS